MDELIPIVLSLFSLSHAVSHNPITPVVKYGTTSFVKESVNWVPICGIQVFKRHQLIAKIVREYKFGGI